LDHYNNGPFETSSRMKTITVDSKKYAIIDMSGIFDTASSVETVISGIMDVVLKCTHEIKAILCVFSGCMRISPNPEIFTPDFIIYQNLLLEIKNHINNTPSVYEKKNLKKVGKKKAETNYNQQAKKITKDYDNRVKDVVVVCSDAAIIGIIALQILYSVSLY
ncbi:2478_t:CDS:2, partial [Cetraspora pellucida]